jgi:hypothetical protein
MVAGGTGCFDVPQSQLFHGGGQGDAGRGPVLGHRDHVGIVRGDFLNNAWKAGAAAILDVPGEKGHYVCQRSPIAVVGNGPEPLQRPEGLASRDDGAELVNQ